MDKGDGRTDQGGSSLKWGLAAALVAVLLAGGVWIGRGKRQAEQQTPVELEAVIPSVPGVSSGEFADISEQLPEVAVQGPVSTDDTREQPGSTTAEDLAQLIANYRELPAGRISRHDAWMNLENLRTNRSPLVETIGDLMRSGNENDRLLAVFLHLELFDEITDVIDRAKHDESPYVQAEVAAWLYERGSFPEFEEYLRDVSPLLTDAHRNKLRELMNGNPPHLEVPAGLAALGLGQSLPLLYRELARYDEKIRGELLGDISRADMRIDQLPRYLEMLSFLSPEEQRGILAEAVGNAEHLRLARYALVRQLAALGMESDSEHVQMVRQILPSPPDGQEQAAVPFREFYVEQLDESERVILEASDEQARQRLLASGALGRYRGALLMTADRAPSRDALAIIRSIEIPYMYREQRQIVADILFIDWIESLGKGQM